VSEIEQGHREPQPATIRKLAKALGVSVADFYAGKAPALLIQQGFLTDTQGQEDLTESHYLLTSLPSISSHEQTTSATW
jgi:transcriptional regulator with XRE-family HTH domain